MNIAIRSLSWITDKNDYLAVVNAISGTKTEFTDDEKQHLLSIYSSSPDIKAGFASDVLIKCILTLDVPSIDILEQPISEAFSALTELCGQPEPDMASIDAVQNLVLSGNIDQSLSISMARAVIDAFIIRDDCLAHCEQITTLLNYVGKVEPYVFTEATLLLFRVRERFSATSSN